MYSISRPSLAYMVYNNLNISLIKAPNNSTGRGNEVFRIENRKGTTPQSKEPPYIIAYMYSI